MYDTFEVVSNDDEGEWREIRLHFLLRELPDRWGLLAGDAIHNMRSALDHLVCAFVLAAGKKLSTSHQFPILNRQPFDKQIARYEANLAGIPIRCRDAITAHQPYLNPLSDLSRGLVMIGKLDNDDKHRAVAPLLISAKQVTLQGLPQGKYQLRFTRGQVPLKPGSFLYAFPSHLVFRDKLDGAIETDVAYGHGHATLDRLEECRVLIREFGHSLVRFGPTGIA